MQIKKLSKSDLTLCHSYETTENGFHTAEKVINMKTIYSLIQRAQVKVQTQIPKREIP